MNDYFGQNLLFVAGGIGLIPLRSCLNYALDHRDRYGKIQLFYGARGLKDLMYLGALREWEMARGFECYLTVDRADDHWTGHVGVVGSLFRKPGVTVPVEHTTAFVCGPHHVSVRDPGPQRDGVSGSEHHVHAGAVHEVRRGQVRSLLHRPGVRVRGRPGLYL